MKAAVMIALVAAACSAGDEDVTDLPTVAVADVVVAPPSGWQMQELGPKARVWSPADNPRKESISIVVGPPILGGADRALAATRTALGLLQDVRITAETRLTTPSGLSGARFELQFRPDLAIYRRYDRSHVVVFVGDHAVHLIYTAASPDPDRTALARAIASIREEG